MSWADDLPAVPGTLSGERRKRVIEEHLLWLSNRDKFETELEPDAPIVAWTARHNLETAKRRAAGCGYYLNTKG